MEVMPKHWRVLRRCIQKCSCVSWSWSVSSNSRFLEISSKICTIRSSWVWGVLPKCLATVVGPFCFTEGGGQCQDLPCGVCHWVCLLGSSIFLQHTGVRSERRITDRLGCSFCKNIWKAQCICVKSQSYDKIPQCSIWNSKGNLFFERFFLVFLF